MTGIRCRTNKRRATYHIRTTECFLTSSKMMYLQKKYSKNACGLAYVKKKQYLCSGFWDKGRKNDGKSPINNDN